MVPIRQVVVKAFGMAAGKKGEMKIKGNNLTNGVKWWDAES
jgi:hypothetical protein